MSKFTQETNLTNVLSVGESLLRKIVFQYILELI